MKVVAWAFDARRSFKNPSSSVSVLAGMSLSWADAENDVEACR